MIKYKYYVEMIPTVDELFTSKDKAIKSAKALSKKNPQKFVHIKTSNSLGNIGYLNPNGLYEQNGLPW